MSAEMFHQFTATKTFDNENQIFIDINFIFSMKEKSWQISHNPHVFISSSLAEWLGLYIIEYVCFTFNNYLSLASGWRAGE